MKVLCLVVVFGLTAVLLPECSSQGIKTTNSQGMTTTQSGKSSTLTTSSSTPLTTSTTTTQTSTSTSTTTISSTSTTTLTSTSTMSSSTSTTPASTTSTTVSSTSTTKLISTSTMSSSTSTTPPPTTSTTVSSTSTTTLTSTNTMSSSTSTTPPSTLSTSSSSTSTTTLTSTSASTTSSSASSISTTTAPTQTSTSTSTTTISSTSTTTLTSTSTMSSSTSTTPASTTSTTVSSTSTTKLISKSTMSSSTSTTPPPTTSTTVSSTSTTTLTSTNTMSSSTSTTPASTLSTSSSSTSTTTLTSTSASTTSSSASSISTTTAPTSSTSASSVSMSSSTEDTTVSTASSSISSTSTITASTASTSVSSTSKSTVSPTNTSAPTTSTLVSSSCILPSGRTCIFPFKYAGVTYNGCTDVDDSRNWCAVSLYSSGEANEYGYCPSSCTTSTVATNKPTTIESTCVLQSGRACVFPFIYAGVTYNGCTDVDDSRNWCAVSLYSSGEANEYGYCPSSCTSSTLATNKPTTKESKCILSTGQACIFPFIYSGVTYNGCTDVDDSRPWCAISLYDSGDANGYGYCPSSCLGASTPPPPTGNSCTTESGRKCVFPFIYSGVSYTGCTTVDDTRPWCATTLYPTGMARDYNYCPANCDVQTKEPTVTPSGGCTTTSGILCIFPFKYGGKTYDSCTPVDNLGMSWCATSLKANMEYANYGNCSPSCPGSVTTPDTTNSSGCMTNSGKTCVFPFTYNGISYTNCTDVDDSRKWCATSLYGSGDARDYGYCLNTC